MTKVMKNQITIEAEGLDITATYDETSRQWTVNDGYNTKVVGSYEEALDELEDICDFHSVNFDRTELEDVKLYEEVECIEGNVPQQSRGGYTSGLQVRAWWSVPRQQWEGQYEGVDIDGNFGDSEIWEGGWANAQDVIDDLRQAHEDSLQ